MFCHSMGSATGGGWRGWRPDDILRAMSNSAPGRSARSGGVVFLQVLLAMLFLAIIGSTVGYLLGEQHNNRQPSAAGPSVSVSSPAPTRTGGGTSTGTPDSGSSTASYPDDDQHCPRYTQGRAHAVLAIVLHIKTTKGSEVWICQAADDTLYYQGHREGSGDDFVEGTNALFLTDVNKVGGEYVARNTNPVDNSITEYHVTAARLVIVYSNYASPKPNATEPAVS